MHVHAWTWSSSINFTHSLSPLTAFTLAINCSMQTFIPLSPSPPSIHISLDPLLSFRFPQQTNISLQINSHNIILTRLLVSTLAFLLTAFNGTLLLQYIQLHPSLSYSQQGKWYWNIDNTIPKILRSHTHVQLQEGIKDHSHKLIIWIFFFFFYYSLPLTHPHNESTDPRINNTHNHKRVGIDTITATK